MQYSQSNYDMKPFLIFKRYFTKSSDINTVRMSEILFQVVSATNYAQKVMNIFHKKSRSIVGWQSTEFAVPPISLLFKLNYLAFVTEIYISPKINKHVKQLEVTVSDDNTTYESVAKIFDFNEGVRVQISAKCRYIKLNILQKDYGKPASLDFLRIYGHEYFRNAENKLLFSQKKDKIQEILIANGMIDDKKWQVDQQTLITLNDMAKLKQKYKIEGQDEELKILIKDFKKVLTIGTRIKQLQNKIKWLNIREEYFKIKDLKDQIMVLSKKRDHYDQKYETSRFEDMIRMDDKNNRLDEMMKSLLEEDMRKMEEQRKRREEEALRKQQEIDQEYKKLEVEDEWWNRKKQELQVIEEVEQKPKKKKETKKEEPPKKEQKEDYEFSNPYVYNQGDADLEKYIKPLLGQFGASYLGDPEMLRKYEQLQYLDVLGARIWIATHSQNWRQRAAAVQAVLDFAQGQLPERYKNGKTRNLFLALMEFARINAQDKVLQIYYTSLKIMTIALAPPICGDDVPIALINKSLQKLMPILIEKISQTNARAKQVSLKTLISMFKHPAADINIAIQQCLRLCKEELNIKFIPVDKQNPRLIESRIEIIMKLLTELPKIEKKKIDYQEILKYLLQGGLFHSHNDVRVLSVDAVQKMYKLYPEGTIRWFKALNGLKPNISAQIQARLKIN